MQNLNKNAILKESASMYLPKSTDKRAAFGRLLSDWIIVRLGSLSPEWAVQKSGFFYK